MVIVESLWHVLWEASPAIDPPPHLLYSAIDSHLINLILIISPPYFVPLRDAFRTLAGKLIRRYLWLCVEVNKMHSSDKRDFEYGSR